MITNHIQFGFSGSVARKYGIPAALVLNRVAWSINSHAESPTKWAKLYFRDDIWWMNDTYESIANHFGGIISKATIKEAIRRLETDGVLISRQFNIKSWDRTKWYSLDPKRWDAIHCGSKEIQTTDETENDTSIGQNMSTETENCDLTPMGHAISHRRDMPYPIEGGDFYPIDEGAAIPIEGGDFYPMSTNNPPKNLIPNNQLDNHPNSLSTPSAVENGVVLATLSDNGVAHLLPEEQKTTAKAFKKKSKAEVSPKTEKPQKAKYEPGDLEVGQAWLELALKEMKWKKKPPSWTPENFAESIAKIRRATDLNFDGLKAVLTFIKRDDFWRPNALSPCGLLKVSSNGNRKIDNILLRMKPKQTYTPEILAELAANISDEDIPF